MTQHCHSGVRPSETAKEVVWQYETKNIVPFMTEEIFGRGASASSIAEEKRREILSNCSTSS